MDKKKVGIAVGCAAVAAVIAICAVTFGGKKDDAAEPAATVETAAAAEPAATPEVTATPEPTAEPAESHDFDSAVNKYKTESDIEIKQYSGDSVSDTADCDSGTDIEEPDTLYDWLYNNGVTRESVQNDRDSGCKNPYLDGYLEYLDSLVDKAAGNVASSQPENAEMTGETVTISGSEFKLDSTGGAYDEYGDYWTKDELADFEVKQKELAEMRGNLDLPEEKHLTEEDKEKADQAVIDAFKDIYG